MKAKLILKTIQSLSLRSNPYDVRDTEIPGFLLRVLPTGKMTYHCDYRRPDGRRTRLKLGDVRVLTPAQARDEALKILGDRARGEDPAKNRKLAKQETLFEFVEKNYKPWVQTQRKTGTQTVRRAIKCFESFMQLKLSEVSPWKVEKWRSERLKAGVNATTVNRNVTMLKAILQKAVTWEKLVTNPIHSIRPLKTDNQAKVRFLSHSEEIALRNALDARELHLRKSRESHNRWCAIRNYKPFPDLIDKVFADHLKPMVLLSLNTGLRRGELFSLQWGNVNVLQRILTVAGSSAKSGKTRHVPLNNEALEVLLSWKKQSEATQDSNLVFLSKAGGHFDNVNKSWTRVLVAANIQEFRWHDLRHHFASSLVMNGVDLNTVRELLGHGDLKMTLRYAHLAPQVKADAVARLDIARESLIHLHTELLAKAKSRELELVQA